MQRIAQASRRTGLALVRIAKLAGVAQGGAEAEVVKLRVEPVGLGLVPGVEEGAAVDRGSEGAEGVPIAVARLEPVDELDAELVCRAGVTDEVGLIDAQKLEQIEDRRDGRFAHAHRPDVRGLDHGDGAVVVGQGAREHAGGDPAGRPAPDDGDALDAVIGRHLATVLGRRRSAGVAS